MGNDLFDVEDLERRVIAHARILQSLIVHIAKDQPHFISHFENCFVETMKMSQHEQDHHEIEDYTEEFIRKVRSTLQKSQKVDSTTSVRISKPHFLDNNHSEVITITGENKGVKIVKDGEIWHVKLDGSFWGDFHTRDDALSALSRLGIEVEGSG